MAIVKTITNEYEFFDWLKQSDNYKNGFSLEGAKALQAYFEQLSDEINESIEFDPVAWCCEFSEYEDFETFQSDTGYIKDGEQYPGYDYIKNIEELEDYTTVIQFDGGIIIQNF